MGVNCGKKIENKVEKSRKNEISKLRKYADFSLIKSPIDKELLEIFFPEKMDFNMIL